MATTSYKAILPRFTGGPWQAVVSPYASEATTPPSANYAAAQKLVLLYKPKFFRNVRSRALLPGNINAFCNFSSGQLPFPVEGEMPCKNGSWQPVAFTVLHAKAFGDAASC